MILTKRKALQLHRELWNGIAEKAQKENRVVFKEEVATEQIKRTRYGTAPLAWCWCCQYAFNKARRHRINPHLYRCQFCPIVWPNITCCSVDGPYEEYTCATIRGDVAGVIKYAKIIANLPEKVVKRNDRKE